MKKAASKKMAQPPSEKPQIAPKKVNQMPQQILEPMLQRMPQQMQQQVPLDPQVQLQRIQAQMAQLAQQQQQLQQQIGFQPQPNAPQFVIPPPMVPLASNITRVAPSNASRVLQPNRIQGPPRGMQMTALFNDDQQLIQAAKQTENSAGKVEIQIKAQRSMAKLKEPYILPAMVSLKTSGGARTSVDLICVIDVSGSMNGEKIQLVRETMKYVVETLTPADRLSILAFNDGGFRLCNLKCVTPENTVSLLGCIQSLNASGGTNIMSGLELALKTIRDRKMPNKVTSIFLLSDGQDKGAENSFKQALRRPQNKQLGVFTIHSFGFGTDHDEELMTKLCGIKDGGFYFIKELATLDEAFCNALGGIISLVASEVRIKVNCIAKGMLAGVGIKETFGSMWQKLAEGQYMIKLSQLMSGITKDYVLEIGIPNIDAEVGDLNRDHDVLQAIMEGKGINGQIISGECVFKLTLLNQSEQFPEVNENVDVIENYLRVKAALAIDENMRKAEQSNFEDAQKGIDDMIGLIRGNKKARPEKMQALVNDLEVMKQKCTKQDYQQEGKKWMASGKAAHSSQMNAQYANSVQTEMVYKCKAKKMAN